MAKKNESSYKTNNDFSAALADNELETVSGGAEERTVLGQNSTINFNNKLIVGSPYKIGDEDNALAEIAGVVNSDAPLFDEGAKQNVDFVGTLFRNQ